MYIANTIQRRKKTVLQSKKRERVVKNARNVPVDFVNVTIDGTRNNRFVHLLYLYIKRKEQN